MTLREERIARRDAVSREPRAASEVEPLAAGRCRLVLRLGDLAKPPPGHGYVVWAEARGVAPQRLGRLEILDHGRAQYRGIVPLDRFRLRITLEPEPAGAAADPPPRDAPVGREIYRTDLLPPFRRVGWYGAAARAR